MECEDEEDGFYYDVLHLSNGDLLPLKVRSMVGLIPLFAVEALVSEALNHLSGFKRRLEWFIANRPDLTQHVACMRTRGEGQRRLLSIDDGEKLRRILKLMLDEREFLSPYGIRAVSRFHLDNPYVLHVNGQDHRVDYEPAESTNDLFGGNSNWRGPVWYHHDHLVRLVGAGCRALEVSAPGGAAPLQMLYRAFVFVASGASFADGVRATVALVLERDARVATGARLTDVVALEGAVVGADATLSCVIVDRGARVPERAAYENGVVATGPGGDCAFHPF